MHYTLKFSSCVNHTLVTIIAQADMVLVSQIKYVPVKLEWVLVPKSVSLAQNESAQKAKKLMVMSIVRLSRQEPIKM